MTFRAEEPRIRKLELETANSRAGSGDAEARAYLEDQTSTQSPNAPQPELPPIIQRLTNTDHSHSVETWYNSAPTAGNQNYECANVYCHEPPAPKIVLDAAITSGDHTLMSAEEPFVPDDAGAIIIVYGAGAAGGKLVTTISSYTSPGEVKLSAVAGTTVANARARWNLQKLERVNTIINGAALTNDALKSSAHPDYLTNINDPDWKSAEGWVRLGSTNTLSYFLGAYTDAAPHTAFEPTVYAIQAQRYMYVIAKIAKRHAGVKVKGHFYAGLWNNDDRNLEYLSGGEFSLSANVEGVPAATATTQYMIVAHTDRGFVYYTSIVSVAGAPDINSYIPGEVEVALNWSPGIPFTNRYEIYRKIGAGNVERIYTVPNGGTAFTDDNPVQRIDTESVNFPASEADNTVKAYTATLLSALDDLVSDGEGNWMNLRLVIPMSASIDVSEMTELVLRMGLTEALAFEISDCVTTAGDNAVTSASALFDAVNHVGKTCTIRDLNDSSNSLTTTVAVVTGDGVIQLTDAPTWSSDQNIIEILEAEPRGLYLDLVGLSFNDGQWSPHTKDDPRPQLPVARPNSSTQGGTGTQDPTHGDGGGPRCFIWSGEATLFDSREKILGLDLRRGMRLYNGTRKPSVIKGVPCLHQVSRLWQIEYLSGAKSVPATLTHRFIESVETARTGTALKHLKAGKYVLRFPKNEFILDSIRQIVPLDFPEGVWVVSIELEEDESNDFAHAFLLGDDLSHNRKLDTPE
jgi:hypothetical protein